MTSVTPDLKDAFSRKNLLKAWEWLNSSSDINYKNHFRSLYKAYSLALDENIVKLEADLFSSRYKAKHSTKLYIPKKSGILRPFSLLTINDQIVYLSLVTSVAEKLTPRAKKNYNKLVFGHLYAGKTSDYFYLKWTDGYVKFNSAIANAFKEGYKWSASFDLTAYYDSIDHKVLVHFLEELKLTTEFNNFLITCLETWTSAGKKRIYHGHGIPQGPISSGLLSEVILQHFDEHKSFKKKSVRYFRYVDDIRILGKTETDVRKALLELDYISKEVGLFPQSGKINIHKIVEITEELKSISLPPEPADLSLSINQKIVIKRLFDLSPRNKVVNETRFKYIVAHLDPAQNTAKKLLAILDKNPHLYQPILKHFNKYEKYSKTVSDKLLVLLKKEQLYEEITATYLLSSLNKIHSSAKKSFIDYCALLQKNRKKIYSPNLRSIIFVWLLNDKYFKFSEIENIYKAEPEWWLITNSLDYIDIDQFGKPSYENLLNSLLKSPSFEIAIKSAYLIAKHNLSVRVLVKDINHDAQLILKKAKLIGKTSAPYTSITTRLEEIVGQTLPVVDWKKFLKLDLGNCERLAVLLVGYFKTDANAFINQLDVFNDYICKSLFSFDSTIGIYTLGSIGSILVPTGRFAMKYPKYYAFCNKIHDLRYQSELSHPLIRRSAKPTRRIRFSEIKKLRTEINKAFTEIMISF